MTNLTIVHPPAEPPYNAHADSLGCWQDGMAYKRLAHLIAQGLAGYMKRGPEHAHMMPSEFAALTVARAHPGVLDAIGGRE